MAISYADAMPPEQAEMSVPQGSESATLAFRGHKIHLIGPLLVPVEELQRNVERAKDLSDATRLLAKHYVEAGYPAARLHYMLMDEELFLVVRLGQITGVDGPEALTRYFRGVEDHVPLRDNHLEPARVLASVHADRMGADVAALFETDDGKTRLKLLPYAELRTTRLQFNFGNPGNRFTGRHFADAEIRKGFSTGDELSAGWQTSISGLSDDDDLGSRDYDDYSAGWSRVTPAGLFGLRARNTEYDFTNTAGDSAGDARIVQVETAWMYPLIAGERHRWIVNAKLDYTNKEAELNDGTEIQDEEYASAETGLDVVWNGGLGEAPLTLEAGAQLRKGLGDHDRLVAQAPDFGYLLVRPRALGALLLGDAWDVELQADFQLTNDTVPEQSQWVLGGLDNLAGYLPGVAVGDSGGLLRGTVSYFDIPQLFGVELVPSVFVEYGYARFERPVTGIAPRGTVELADAGAQLDLRWRHWLRGRIAIARGIGDSGIDQAALDDSEANFYFNLRVSF